MHRRRAIPLLLAVLVAAVAGACLAALTGTRPAAAGTEEDITVVSTRPVDGAELSATPSEIVLTFQNRLPAIQPIVQLQNSRNELQEGALGQALAIENRYALRIRVLKELPAGTYRFSWLIRPQVGKEVAGSIEFTLVAPPTTTDDTTPEGGSGSSTATTAAPRIDTGGLGIRASSTYSGLLGILGRTLAYIGLAALAGGLLLIATAWSDGVEYVLTVKHFWTAWGVAVVGSLLTVATAASDFTGISTARGLVPTEWGDLLKTDFGKAIVFRLLAVVGCAWIAGRPERVIDPRTRLMSIGIPAMALVTYGWHRDVTDIGVSTIAAGAVHALAGAAWFGGAALLFRVVLAAPGDEDLVKAIRGFRPIFLLSMLGVLISGAIQTSTLLGGGGNLTSTSFGRIFLLKIVVVALMAFVATANRQYARQRLARQRHLDVRPAEHLHRTVRTEVLAGALVFLLGAWLTGTSAPGLSAADAVQNNKNTYVSDDGSFRAEIVFGPKRVGARVEFHFKLKEPESIKDGTVVLSPVDGKSNAIEIPILGSPNYGFGPSQGFLFGSSGTWTITISGEGPDGELPTITDTFVVNNQDGSAPATPTTSTTPTSEDTESDTSGPDTSGPDTSA